MIREIKETGIKEIVKTEIIFDRINPRRTVKMRINTNSKHEYSRKMTHQKLLLQTSTSHDGIIKSTVLLEEEKENPNYLLHTMSFSKTGKAQGEVLT